MGGRAEPRRLATRKWFSSCEPQEGTLCRRNVSYTLQSVGSLPSLGGMVDTKTRRERVGDVSGNLRAGTEEPAFTRQGDRLLYWAAQCPPPPMEVFRCLLF